MAAVVKQSATLKSLGEASVVGFRFIFDVDAPVAKRVYWITLILIGTAFCIYHVSNRLSAYLAKSTVAQVNMIEVDELVFPQVSFCIEYNIERTIPSIYASNLTEYVQSIFPNANELFRKSTFISANVTAEMLPVDSYVCYIFNRNRSMTLRAPGFETGLAINTNDLAQFPFIKSSFINGILFTITTAGELPTIFYNPLLLRLEEHHELSFTVELIHLLDNEKCIPNESGRLKIADQYSSYGCLSELIMESYVANTRCLFPTWSLLPEAQKRHLWPDYPAGLPICNNHADLRKYYEIRQNITLSLQAKQRCKTSCKLTIYNIQLEKAPVPRHAGVNETILHAYAQSLLIKQSEQMLAYEWLAMLADVGGALGLFLGACLYTLLDLLQVIVDICLRKLNKKPSHLAFLDVVSPKSGETAAAHSEQTSLS